MPKGLLSLLVSIIFSVCLVTSTLIVTSQKGEASSVPREPTGACYAPGKGCKDDTTLKSCYIVRNNFNYFYAGQKCVPGTEVLTESHWIEACTDPAKLPEAEKKCREKLEAEVKAQESGKSPFPICPDQFKVVAPVAITASYVHKEYKLCIANCAMVYQCVKSTDVPPPPPEFTPTPSPSPTPPSSPSPSPSPTPKAPLPPLPSESPSPTPSNKVPPPPPGY